MKYMIAALTLSLCLLGVIEYLHVSAVGNLDWRGPYKLGQRFRQGTMETSPVVFEGKLYVVAGDRPSSGIDKGTSISIYSYRTEKLIEHVQIKGMGLISAFVHRNRIYIFGASDWSKPNEIRMVSSPDLIHWTTPIAVFQAPDSRTIFNSSVASAPDGFVMTYEVKSGIVFFPRFAKSHDLIHWTDVPSEFDRVRYAACPIIRYLRGYYYLLYLAAIGDTYQTVAARSTDLIHWEYAGTPAFVPQKSDGISASDVDVASAYGLSFFTYAVGDQADWVALQRAIYFGSLSDFFGNFTYGSIRKL